MLILFLIGIALCLASITLSGYSPYLRLKISESETSELKKIVQNSQKILPFGIAVQELEKRGEELKTPLFERLLSGGIFTRWQAWLFVKRHFPDKSSTIDFNWRQPSQQAKTQIKGILATNSGQD